MRKIKLTILIGKKHSGKTTYAKDMSSAKRVALATPIKEFVDGFIPGKEVEIDKEQYRPILQEFGDIVRAWDKDAFVKNAAHRMYQDIRYLKEWEFVIDDCRYTNEVNIYKYLGNYLDNYFGINNYILELEFVALRVYDKRTGLEVNLNDKHSSEQEVDASMDYAKMLCLTNKIENATFKEVKRYE